MRKLVFLKTCLDFLFFILILGGIVAMISSMIFNVFEDIPGHPFVLNGNEYIKIDAGVVTIAVFMFLAYALFVYCVYWFRKIVRMFMKTRLFDDLVIRGFQRVGISLVLIAFFVHIPDKVYMAFNNANVNLNLSLLGGGFLDSFLFLLSLGLFFMVLGRVFRIAKNAKEDNELTV